MARILLIDDDASLRTTLRKVLERSGHEVAVAGDGRQGMVAFAAASPDLVITDLIMPEQEGIETILAIRESHPEVKILAISGGGAVEPGGPLDDAELLGADASLAKPFSLEDLHRTVKRLLG